MAVTTPFVVLIVSVDSSILDSDPSSEVMRRHVEYARHLDRVVPGSRIMIVAPGRKSARVATRCEFLDVYAVRSLGRIGFLFSALYWAFQNKQKLLSVRVVTSQSPADDGLVAFVISRWLRASFVPQVHFDITSRHWIEEKRRNRLIQCIARLLLRRANYVRVMSSAQVARLSNSFRVDQRRIFVAPVPVLYASRSEGELNERSECFPTVTFVGRLVAQKNLPLWLDVANRVSAKVKCARFLIIGDGPERPWLERQIARSPIRSQFEIVGKVSYDHLSAYFERSSVLLLTSHYEGYGRVLVEAYLSLVPCVATACCGPEDIVVDGVSGYLVSPGNSAQLADRVTQLLLDESRRKAFATAGRLHVAAHHNRSTLIDNIVNGWCVAASSI